MPKSQRLESKKQLRALRRQAKQERLALRAQSGTLVAERVVGYSLLAMFLGLLALVAATFYTPLLAIQNIEIQGNQRIASAELEKSLEQLVQQPLTTVSESQITALLADYSLLESFAFQAIPPSTLELIIRERQPVATVAVGSKLVLFDAAGVKLADATESDEYPQILIAEDPAESQRYAAAVRVLLSLPVDFFREIDQVQLQTRDSVVLILKQDATKVIWGNATDAQLKYEVLTALMNNQEDVVDYDVSSPLAPVVTFRDF